MEEIITPTLATDPSLFLDKTIAIYGPSMSGKTVITKNIMNILRSHIEQIIVISPSEPSNQSYKGFVDPLLIHYDMHVPTDKKQDKKHGDTKFLENIWKRQEMLATVYAVANNGDVLLSLFSRLPREVKDDGLDKIKLVQQRQSEIIAGIKKKYGAEAGKCEEKIMGVKVKIKEMVIALYKVCINQHYRELWAKSLSSEEKTCLMYLNLNPRLLIVFDDCAAQLKTLMNTEIFRKYFYQNRHCFITVIMCFQDDTDLSANLRKNVFISFFTNAIVATSFFNRPANNFPKDIRQYVDQTVRGIFVGNRKFAYIREDIMRNFYYSIEFPYPEIRRFGSDAIHELCDAIQSNGVSINKSNPFYDAFKI